MQEVWNFVELPSDNVRGVVTVALHWETVELRRAIAPQGSPGHLFEHFEVAQRGPRLDRLAPDYSLHCPPIVLVRAMERMGCHYCWRWGRCLGRCAEIPMEKSLWDDRDRS